MTDLDSYRGITAWAIALANGVGDYWGLLEIPGLPAEIAALLASSEGRVLVWDR